MPAMYLIDRFSLRVIRSYGSMREAFDSHEVKATEMWVEADSVDQAHFRARQAMADLKRQAERKEAEAAAKAAEQAESARLRALLRATVPLLVKQEVSHHLASINARIRRDHDTVVFEQVAANHCRHTIDKILAELDGVKSTATR
jgi:hypothetical protein